jgi:type IV secretory pathway VirB2 component (pilin)
VSPFYATIAIFAALWTFTGIPPFLRQHVPQELHGCRGRCLALCFYLAISAVDVLTGADGWRLAGYWIAIVFVLIGNAEQTRRIAARGS